MHGTLQKIVITDDMIRKIAEVNFGDCNDGDKLCDQNAYVQGMWLDGAVDDLNNFNCLVVVLKKIGIGCVVENCGCGHDIDEFYKE